MSQAAPELPSDVRQRIDEYLDAVERVLIRGNVTRTERRSIVDEVESGLTGKKSTNVAMSSIMGGTVNPDEVAHFMRSI